MKSYLLTFAVAIAASVAFGQQPDRTPPLVITSGSAEIQVVPDVADLSFEVEIRNADLTLALKRQAERTTKILAALRAAGVAEAELQTSQVVISSVYTDRHEATQKIDYFTVSQDISCTLHDVKKVPDITAAAVTAGATGTRHVNLRTSKLRKYRDEARAKAIRAAKEKAVAFAAELGAKIGKPYRIFEGLGYEGMSSTNNAGAQIPQGFSQPPAEPDDGTSPTFALGTISVTADVTVSFLLE